MKDRQIDEIFEHSAAPAPDPMLFDRISASMAGSLRPVRPVAPAWMRVSGLFAVAALVALIDALWLGMDGFRKLATLEIVAIFAFLAVLLCAAAMMCVREMTPGGGWRIRPATLLLIAMVGWLAMDGILFRNYETTGFVPQGIPCMRAGLWAATPVGGVSWLILRRGFAVDSTAAGLAAGTLAGLAGLAMLELHCANFQTLHIMFWHTAVIPVSAMAGALLARIGVRRN